MSGTGRPQQFRKVDCVCVEQSKERTASPLRIPKTEIPASKLGSADAVATHHKLIPNKDFFLDVFLEKQDTDIVSGSKV
jgi:hypothetical protein